MASLAGIPLEHPLINAAGTCKTRDDVEKFSRAPLAALVIGSLTVAARQGNPGDVYWSGPRYSLNSLGLPNRGLTFYADSLPQMVELSHTAGKRLIANVAGFTADDYARLATAVASAGVDLIELNLGCPNVWNDGTQERIACFDTSHTLRICQLVEQALRDTESETEHSVFFGIKVSPFSDPRQLAELAAGIADETNRLSRLRFITAVNTFPNAVELRKDGRPVLDVTFAGLSGAAMKPIGLGQVRQLRALLPDTIDVVGVGGILNGQDVADYMNAGASAVQACTAYWNNNENPNIFGQILTQYADLSQ